VPISAKRTMTLNLSDAEMAALEELARKRELTKTGVIRQALRLFQMVDLRLEKGERLMFEGDADKKSELLVL
jgi:predicted transcriptional regulator